MIVFDENADKIKHEARHRMERAICSKKKKEEELLAIVQSTGNVDQRITLNNLKQEGSLTHIT